MEIDVKKVKIIVTVPVGSVNDVRTVLCESGAGVIGNYSCCSVMTKCIGTFKPNDNTNPYIGDKNKINYVEEQRLEVVCDVNIVKDVLIKLKNVHPYEEPAIDIIPLIDEKFFS